MASKRRYVAIPPTFHHFYFPLDLHSRRPFRLWSFPKNLWEAPFGKIPPINLLKLRIHLSQSLVIFKVPSYSGRPISSCEKHNGRNERYKRFYNRGNRIWQSHETKVNKRPSYYLRGYDICIAQSGGVFQPACLNLETSGPQF